METDLPPIDLDTIDLTEWDEWNAAGKRSRRAYNEDMRHQAGQCITCDSPANDGRHRECSKVPVQALHTGVHVMTWTDRAACHGQPDAVFYPPAGRHASASARALCATCAVRARCLAAALEYEGGKGIWNRHGIWGGLTPQERADLAGAA